MEKYYGTEIDSEKQCVYVFVNDLTFINTVRGIIQIMDCIKDIKDSYSKVDRTTKIIEVSPKQGISIDFFELTIHSRLDEISDEVFEVRKKLSNMGLNSDDIKIFDRVILRMMNNKYECELIEDMHIILGELIRKLTGINIVSLIKQYEKTLVEKDKHKIDFLTQAVQLFRIFNTLIARIDELKLIRNSNDNSEFNK